MTDLSMLTPSEVKQFDDNQTVLISGNTDVALYMRFSSDKQSEQSIEGQLRDAISFCKLRQYRIRAIYVDRAKSAKSTEKRTSFLQMISDSAKKQWEYVLVWKLDRFARSRNDSAFYKMMLKKNGVKVLSVTENITDAPEGIILESLLEGMAEFYSAELSQKITRGRRESALKCQSIGGHIPIGYKVVDHKFVPDPKTAPIVQRAFKQFAEGVRLFDIIHEFNAQGLKTSKGADFNKSSFQRMFTNKKYIGTYQYMDMEIENGIPAIIDKETFEMVQERIRNAKTLGKKEKPASPTYLLLGKIFCGHCEGAMSGDTGTSHTGKTYSYYSCYNKRMLKNNCTKKSVPKDEIENFVLDAAKSILTDSAIEEIADIAMDAYHKEQRSITVIPELKAKIQDTEKAISNLTAVIEKGVASDSIIERLGVLEDQRKDLYAKLADESEQFYYLDRDQIIFWLYKFKDMELKTIPQKQRMIDMLINSVTVWDDPDGGYRVTIAYNLSSHPSQTLKSSQITDALSVRGNEPAAPPKFIFTNFCRKNRTAILIQTIKHP